MEEEGEIRMDGWTPRGRGRSLLLALRSYAASGKTVVRITEAAPPPHAHAASCPCGYALHEDILLQQRRRLQQQDQRWWWHYYDMQQNATADMTSPHTTINSFINGQQQQPDLSDGGSKFQALSLLSLRHLCA